MTDLMELASRVEAGEGPDRELDLAIHLALDPDGQAATLIKFGTRGLTGEAGQRWELSRGALLYEQRDERGNCWANGGVPIAAYTASTDAALSLVPAGHTVQLSDWDHEVLREKGPWQAIILPFGARGAMQQFTFTNRCDHAATAPLALTIAALRARAHQGAAHVD